MPQNWEFSNVGADCTPEIVINATNPITSGEKVLLFQVGTGCFGRPVILSTTSTNGQATQLVIGFGDASGGESLDIDKNFDNLEIIPAWNVQDRKSGFIQNKYTYDEARLQDQELKRARSYKQKLFFVIPKYDLIKDYNPRIIIEKYTPAKGFANRNKSTAGFKRAPLLSNIPVESEKFEVEFRQEEFFRLGGPYENPNLKAKSLKKIGKSVHNFLQFRISLSINGSTYITVPVLKLKMQATFHRTGSQIRGEKLPDQGGPPQQDDSVIPDFQVAIGYRRT